MSTADAAVLFHRFTVHTEPHPNALARIIAPFVIHDVLPSRLSATADAAGTDYVLSIEFSAAIEVAHRLGNRIAAMPVVCRLTRDAVEAVAAAA
jgi:hypothetical protein